MSTKREKPSERFPTPSRAASSVSLPDTAAQRDRPAEVSKRGGGEPEHHVAASLGTPPLPSQLVTARRALPPPPPRPGPKPGPRGAPLPPPPPSPGTKWRRKAGGARDSVPFLPGLRIPAPPHRGQGPTRGPSPSPTSGPSF